YRAARDGNADRAPPPARPPVARPASPRICCSGLPSMSARSEEDAAKIRLVERFLACFEGRWPSENELVELLAPDIRVTDRPNLVNPAGGARDAAGVRAGVEAGRGLLAWQSYQPRDHLVSGDTVVTRMRWSGELAIEVGAWPAGTRLAAWCVAHYR